MEGNLGDLQGQVGRFGQFLFIVTMLMCLIPIALGYNHRLPHEWGCLISVFAGTTIWVGLLWMLINIIK